MSNDRIHTYYAITVFPIVRPNLPNSRLIVMILLLIFIHFLIQGDYYIPCLKLPEEEQQPIGMGTTAGNTLPSFFQQNTRRRISTAPCVW